MDILHDIWSMHVDDLLQGYDSPEVTFMKRCILFALVFVLIVFLTGCSILPGEERSFVVVLAINQLNNQWQTCARVPTYQQNGEYHTIVAYGDTLASALSALNRQAPMPLHYGQARAIVFGRHLAESSEMQSALEVLSHLRDMRQDAVLLVTTVDIVECCQALRPITGARLSKSLDELFRTRKLQGVASYVTLADVQRFADRQAIIAGLCQPSASIASNQDLPSFQMVGCCLFNYQHRSCIQLTADETQLLALLLGQWKHGVLNFGNQAYQIAEASCQVDLNPPNIKVSLRICLADALADVETMQQQLYFSVQKLCHELSAKRCDAFGIGRQAMKYFDTYETWEKANWPEIYAALHWNIDVDIHLPTVS